MDSKNVIWLSSFFALLFITFCVTKHLDDLNPNIVSLPNHTGKKELIAHNNNTQQSIIAQKLETQKLETQKLETQKLETQKLETQKLETTEKFSAATFKTSTPIVKSLSAIEEVQKSITTKPHTIAIKKHANIKPKQKTRNKKKKSYKKVPLGSIHLDLVALTMIQENKNINELNKLSYMYTIHKDSQVSISTDDKTSANAIKRYLLSHHVKASDIHIVRGNNQKNLIKITLTGRK